MDPGESTRSAEADAVKARYARRDPTVDASRYGPTIPSVYMAAQERQRALIRLLRHARLEPLAGRSVLEIGCGSGANLLELIQLGFDPGCLAGNELLPERLATARHRLPEAVVLHPGDAASLDLPESSLDIVYQSMVFTSLLDGTFQETLARRMWSWVRPGGGILWYDFVYDNPRNRDVRGVGLRRIRQLFPEARVTSARVTLAPPISRIVTRVAPRMYDLVNAVPWLRTHRLCWISKTR